MRVKYLMPFLLLFTVFAIAQDKTPKPKDNVSIYVVRPGDSLWKISKNFFDTPVFWPRLWKLNPAIDNPARIYPGEVIALKQQAPKLPIAKFDPERRSYVIAELDPPPPVFYYSLAQKIGFITPDEWEHMGTIINSEPPRVLLAKTQNIEPYINLGTDDNVVVGDRFTIFRTSKTVFHPVTHKRVGKKVAILGELEVKEVLGEKLSLTKITSSNREIMRGDRLRPAEEFVKEVVIRKGTTKTEGYIVESRNNLHLSAMFDVVYIDAGRRDKVVPGNTFTIYQYPRVTIDLDSGKNITIPKLEIGRLVVLDVRKETSTGFILESSRQVIPGDLISLDL